MVGVVSFVGDLGPRYFLLICGAEIHTQKNEVAKFSHRQNYTEIFDGREFLPGPELPWGAYMSCATEVEPGVVFVSGRPVVELNI